MTSWQALGFTAPKLRLPLDWSTEAGQARDELKPVGILEKVTLIPGVLSAQVYGPFLAAMFEPFYAFAYDWRRDNFESAELFEKFLEDVRIKNPGKRIRLVAHSNGGLVSWVVVSRHPEWFENVYFAGVPFAGGVGFLPDLATGTPNGLNHRILRPEVVGTFPSVFTFFDLQGRGLAGADFFSPATWKQEGWGIYHSPIPAADTERVERFMKSMLARAAKFRALLVKGTKPYPPLHVIRSRTTPTLKEILRKQGGRELDFEGAPKCAGDGRVCADDALPPGGAPATIHEVPAEHAELLNDPGVIELIRHLIRPAR